MIPNNHPIDPPVPCGSLAHQIWQWKSFLKLQTFYSNNQVDKKFLQFIYTQCFWDNCCAFGSLLFGNQSSQGDQSSAYIFLYKIPIYILF